MTRFSASLLLAGVAGIAAASVMAFTATRQDGGPSPCESAYAEFDAPEAPRLWVEIADDPAERALGLMHREWLDPDSGMLFVFEQSSRAAFWMKDTLIPLSIAFIDQDWNVVDIQDMEPLSLEPHGPPADYRYALEANVGWFADHGVGLGSFARLCFT